MTDGAATSGGASSGSSTGGGVAGFGAEGTFKTGGFPVIEGMTGGMGARKGAVSVAEAEAAAATDVGGAAEAFAPPPPAMKAFTLATSSSVRLAKAEPFPPDACSSADVYQDFAVQFQFFGK